MRLPCGCCELPSTTHYFVADPPRSACGTLFLPARISQGPHRLAYEYWWTGEDSNLRSPQGAADLQSAGFSHSPTRPHGGITRLEGYCALKRRDTIPPVSQCRNPPPENKRESSPDSKFLWQSWRRDLNPRPSDYKSDALPTELRRHGSNRENITKGHENCKGLYGRVWVISRR